MYKKSLPIGILLLLTLLIAACQPTAVEPTVAPSDTPAPTQTPHLIIITATPSPTLRPTNTPLPTEAVPTQDVKNPILDNCFIRTDWPTYRVVSGDTLSNLAVRTDSTTTNLQLANCIENANLIRVGQQLRVPRTPDPRDDGVVVQDLITAFSISPVSAAIGDTVTLSWASLVDTRVEIESKTTDDVLGENLNSIGTLTFTVPELDDSIEELEFIISGSKREGNRTILASPYSIFLEIVEDSGEATEEPVETEEPEETEEPAETEEPEETEEPAETEEPEETEEPS